MNILEKIEFLNNGCKYNWQIIFHGIYVDINYPDSPIGPNYEDYLSLDEVLDDVIKDIKKNENKT